MRASNLYRDERSRDMLGKYIQLITRFNVFLELGIRRRSAGGEGDIFMIESSKIRSIDV